MDGDEPLSLGYLAWAEERRARFDAARDRIAAAVSDCIQILREDEHPDDPPFVQGWMVAAEWTNVAAERENWGGRDTIEPHGQMLSIGTGLGAWAANRHI